MKDTADLRKKVLALWGKFDDGKLTATEARTHIGFARTLLDAVKVEIAAAHLNQRDVPAVSIGAEPVRVVGAKRLARAYS